MSQAVAAGFQPCRLGFNPTSVHVGSVVDKVESGHVFLRALRFSPVRIVPSMIISINSSITQAILSSRVPQSLNNTHNAHLRFIIQSLFKDSVTQTTQPRMITRQVMQEL